MLKDCCRSRFWVGAVLGLLFLVSSPGWAQTPGPLVVGFVEDQSLGTASTSDEGEDGLARLAEIFRFQGAQTRTIRVDEPIPDEVNVVVLVRPQQTLPVDFVARLWLHIERGNNLLLAIDANGFAEVSSEQAGGGFNRLITLEYGLTLLDGLLIEPWHEAGALQELINSESRVLPEGIVNHPLIAPLTAHDLPVQIWGGRPIHTEAIGPDTAAFALLFTESAYGETTRINFTAAGAAPLAANIGQDSMGHLLVGGIGQNAQTGSRVVLLGDSELLQNIYGLKQIPDTTLPRYPGNRIFVERLVAWLLETPEAQWPGLPAGFTWISLDGRPTDWDDKALMLFDATSDAPESFDIQRVRVFHNDQFLYGLVQTRRPPAPGLWIEIDFGGVTAEPFTVTLQAEEITASVGVSAPEVIPDAALRIGEAIEFRLPLRIVGETPTIRALCLSQNEVFGNDCLEVEIVSPLVDDRDPAPVRPADAPLAVVFSDIGARLRSGPGLNFSEVTFVSNGTLFTPVGRNEAGDWIRIEDGHYSGWMASFLLRMGLDVLSLPVVP